MYPLMVFTVGDPQQALALAERAERAGSWTTVTPQDLGATFVVGAGTIAACAPTAITPALRRAEGHLRYRELDEAMTAITSASDGLACAVGEQALGSRVAFVLGVIAEARGDAEAARAAFQRALRYEPGLGWDPDLSPAGRLLFDEVAAASPASGGDGAVDVHVVPHLSASVDGVPVVNGSARVHPGRHLVELPEPYTLTVEGPLTIVVPTALHTSDVRDAHAAGDLAVAIGAGTWVVDGDPPSLFRPEPGAASYIPYDARRRPIPLVPVAGGLIAGAGLALAAVSFGQGRAAWRDSLDAVSWAEVDQAATRRDAAADWLLVGEVVAGLGLCTLVLSVAR